MTDELGMRRALPPRMLPCLVAAMSFLAALALGGAVAARMLAQRWDTGAGALISVQVPDPEAPSAADPATSRIDAVSARLAADARLSGLHRLAPGELADLLRPWLGGAGSLSLPLPAVIELRLRTAAALPSGLAQSLAPFAPGTLVEDSAVWSGRLLALTASLQACAWLALLTVVFVAACVVSLATRAGISTRRHAIEIMHGLGAGDGLIAGRFARRAGFLALLGGGGGALVALPLLGILSRLASPFAASRVTPDTLPGSMTPFDPTDLPGSVGVSGLTLLAELPSMVPLPLLLLLPAVPVAAAVIGWLTAQATVRIWLRRLP